MSSQTLEPSESTRLLHDSQPVGQSSRSPPKKRHRISPETLLIPVAFATRLASLLPTTTLVELVRQIVCELWKASHSDQPTLPAGPLSADLCDAPEVERYFSMVVAAVAVVDALIVMLTCGLLSHFSSQYGRRPALSFALVAGITSGCLIAGSQSAPDWLSSWLFLIGILMQSVSGMIVYAFLANAYTVDVCAPEDRTAALSRVSGWAILGTCISYGTGGFVTTKTGNPLIVFYIATLIYLITLIYVLLILPESFTEEKRKALVRIRLEQSNDEPSATASSSLFTVFEPLKVFIPSTKPNGSRNWRLTLFAAHLVVVATAGTYVGAGWIVFVTSKYHFTPADTGLFLTIASISSAIALTLILPSAIRFLRPYYQRRMAQSHPEEQYLHNRANALESETSERLDIHVTFVSWTLAGVAYLFAARATTVLQLVISGLFIGLSIVHIPTLRSLVAGSVNPLKQGETLAAVEMLSSIGGCLSTVIMGSILTASIGTMPLLMFYIHLVFVVLGSGILFFVREADKYQKPLEP